VITGLRRIPQGDARSGRGAQYRGDGATRAQDIGRIQQSVHGAEYEVLRLRHNHQIGKIETRRSGA
jgi:hypothetical protein